MVQTEAKDGASHLYEATNVTCTNGGSTGYTVRVLPKHQDQVSMQRSGLVAWAQYADSPDVPKEAKEIQPESSKTASGSSV